MVIMNENYGTLNNVPYLAEGKDDYSKYVEDISDVLTYNQADKNNIFSKVRDYNKAIEEYLYYRGGSSATESNPVFTNELDKQLIMALRSNNEQVIQNMQEKNEKHKKVKNLIDSLSRSQKYHGMVNDIIKGYGVGDNKVDGELDIVNEKYDELQTDLENKRRHLQVSLYTENKLKKQNSVLRNVFIFLMVLLIVSIVKRLGIMSDLLYASIVVLIFAMMFIYIVYEAIDIYFRDSVDFNMYRFLHKPGTSNGIDLKKEQPEIPLHLQFDIPGYCKIREKAEDAYLKFEDKVADMVDKSKYTI